MNRLLVYIVACAALVVADDEQTRTCVAEEQSLAIERAVIAKHAEVIGYAEQLDAEKLYGVIAEGGKGTVIQDGRVLTRQEALDSSELAYEGFKSQKIEILQQYVRVLSPEIAVLTAQGRYAITTDTGETVSSDFAVTSVFVLQENEWKIVYGHHSTPNISIAESDGSNITGAKEKD